MFLLQLQLAVGGEHKVPAAALELLREGLRALAGFGWAFPPESSQNTARDQAVDAFRTLFLGASRLMMVWNRATTGPSTKSQISAALEGLAADWPGVLCFLSSLYRDRKVFSLKIYFLVAKLSELSPSFAAAAREATCELPSAPVAQRRDASVAADRQRTTEVQAERAVFVGTRVEAFYEGQWYRGTIVSVPAEDEEGRWIVQCDVDAPGTLTYAKSVSSRVEALYEGQWYRGSVVSVPSEDEEGCWAVQCDVDPPGVLTKTTTVRVAPGAREPATVAAAAGAPATPAAAPTVAAAAAAALALPEALVHVEGTPVVASPQPPGPRGARQHLGALALVPETRAAGAHTPPVPQAPPQ